MVQVIFTDYHKGKTPYCWWNYFILPYTMYVILEEVKPILLVNCSRVIYIIIIIAVILEEVKPILLVNYASL